jgi:hypothetical protein
MWSNWDNWSIGQPPMVTDSVLHNNEHPIQMDAGTISQDAQIMDFYGDGAAGGGLTILTRKGLRVAGSALLLLGAINVWHPNRILTRKCC